MKLALSMWPQLLVLGLVWWGIVWVVNPLGEFMINDDWSFVRAFQTMEAEGRLMETGWGPHRPGGPSLLVHLLWGRLFTTFFGYSLTTLRVSVLVSGILGSVVLLLLLGSCGASKHLSLWGALTLVVNPLFLSQCFTFMTDIPFTSFSAASVALLYLGWREPSRRFIVLGLALSLCATLIRQMGLVIPLGFLLACRACPRPGLPHTQRLLFLVTGLILVPWLLYEAFLHFSGSTPVTHHQLFHAVLHRFLEEGAAGFFLFVLTQTLPIAIAYTSFFVLPITVLQAHRFLERTGARWLTAIVAVAFLVTELSIARGIIDPPVGFHRNVIVNWSIGPILLKDVYILKIPRLTPIPVSLYYGLVFAALFASILLLAQLVQGRLSLRLSWGGKKGNASAAEPSRLVESLSTAVAPGRFLGIFCLFTASAYLGIICVTGFHDRYLIPLCLFLIVWLVGESQFNDSRGRSLSSLRILPAAALLAFMACFSVAGTHDFMELKRNVKKAHDYLLNDLKVDPCQVDGGFEFNGYHCSRHRVRVGQGLSWWWVVREDYLVALGPLPGYEVVREFPFSRIWGKDGTVYVLRPQRKGSSQEEDENTNRAEGIAGRQRHCSAGWRL